MRELELKYGCNPNQKPARIFMRGERELPITVLNGKPGYINFLDAFNSWQLVRELKAATGMPAAASFKHVSPAGAALGKPICETGRKILLQKAVEVLPDDTPEVLQRRVMEQAEWILLPRAAEMVCAQLTENGGGEHA